jgi:hypothetical protein
VTGQPVKALGAQVGGPKQAWSRVVLCVLAIVLLVMAFNVRDWSRPSRADYIQQVEAACANAGNSAAAVKAIRNLDTPAGDNSDINDMLADLDRADADVANYRTAYNSGNFAQAEVWLARTRQYVVAANNAAKQAGIDCLSLGG